MVRSRYYIMQIIESVKEIYKDTKTKKKVIITVRYYREIKLNVRKYI